MTGAQNNVALQSVRLQEGCCTREHLSLWKAHVVDRREEKRHGRWSTGYLVADGVDVSDG